EEALDGVDRSSLASTMQPAFQFAQDHHVPIYCGEFGVFKPRAPRQDRLQWITDTATLLRSNGVGGAMWEYNHGLGATDENNQWDNGVLQALGLHPPAQSTPP